MMTLWMTHGPPMRNDEARIVVGLTYPLHTMERVRESKLIDAGCTNRTTLERYGLRDRDRASAREQRGSEPWLDGMGP